MRVGRDDVILLTPGPLTTAGSTKRAMLRDWGSREGDFSDLTGRVCRRIEALAGIGPRAPSHVCVPLAGSGTYALEAAIGTLCSPRSSLLVLANGTYGRRLAEIAEALGRPCRMVESAEERPIRADDLDRILADEKGISHVALVHCETSSGVLNPVGELAEVCRRHRREVLIDAMSTFGAIEIDAAAIGALAIVASANKCLEGVPGLAFVITERGALEESHADSLVLDLGAQWRFLHRSGQFRFTPPVQVIAALDDALDRLEEEGGVEARGRRYRTHQRILNEGMRALGFDNPIPPSARSPIIQSFRWVKGFDLSRFHGLLRKRGYAIYPGSMTRTASFRVGCIGAIGEDDIRSFLQAAASALKEMKK